MPDKVKEMQALFKINKLTFKLEPEVKAVAEPRTELGPMAAPEPDPIEAPKP